MKYDLDSLQELDALCGTPAHVLDPARFAANYQAFLGAFQAVYPRTQLAYSYKTNYIPHLCRIVDVLGGWAEVVSEMEYELALALGVEAENIVYNGPCKDGEAIGRALLAGSIVNLDSVREVETVCDLAAEYGHEEFVVGLRVNFALTGAERPSRFGLSVEDGALTAALARIEGVPNLRVDGLHCHYMVPGKTAAGFAEVARRMIEVLDAHFPDGGLRFVDVGGGFFSPVPPELAAQFPAPPPSYEDYARAVAAPFAERFAGETDPPLLVLEPGIALTADVVDYVTKVFDLKTIAGRGTAVVDGTIYDIKPTLNTVNLPLERIAAGSPEQPGPWDVTGHTCMEHDVMYRGFAGPLARDDYLVVANAGAYTVVLRPPFIRPHAPVVARTDEGWFPVRRAGRKDDVFGSFEPA